MANSQIRNQGQDHRLVPASKKNTGIDFKACMTSITRDPMTDDGSCMIRDMVARNSSPFKLLLIIIDTSTLSPRLWVKISRGYRRYAPCTEARSPMEMGRHGQTSRRSSKMPEPETCSSTSENRQPGSLAYPKPPHYAVQRHSDQHGESGDKASPCPAHQS